MKKLIIINLLFNLFLISGCTPVAEKDMPVNMKKSHKVIISGTVGYIDRVDVDKRGKHEKFMLHFTLKVDSYDDSSGWALIGSIIKCVVKEQTVIAQTGRTLQSGDKVILTANIMDIHPEVISVQRIKFAD
jgi:hypothetical protein